MEVNEIVNTVSLQSSKKFMNYQQICTLWNPLPALQSEQVDEEQDEI